MNLKNLYPYIYGILVVLVFVFGFIGFYDYLGHEAHFWPVLFSVLSFFAFDDGDEGQIWAGNPANPVLVPYILVAKYLALALIGLGISEIFFKYIKVTFQAFKISLFYRKHIVIFSLDSIGYHLAKGLLKDGYQVVVIEKKEASPFGRHTHRYASNRKLFFPPGYREWVIGRNKWHGGFHQQLPLQN